MAENLVFLENKSFDFPAKAVYDGESLLQMNPDPLQTFDHPPLLGDLEGPRPFSLDYRDVWEGDGKSRLLRGGQFDTGGVDHWGGTLHALPEPSVRRPLQTRS